MDKRSPETNPEKNTGTNTGTNTGAGTCADTEKTGAREVGLRKDSRARRRLAQQKAAKKRKERAKKPAEINPDAVHFVGIEAPVIGYPGSYAVAFQDGDIWRTGVYGVMDHSDRPTLALNGIADALEYSLNFPPAEKSNTKEKKIIMVRYDEPDAETILEACINNPERALGISDSEKQEAVIRVISLMEMLAEKGIQALLYRVENKNRHRLDDRSRVEAAKRLATVMARMHNNTVVSFEDGLRRKSLDARRHAAHLNHKRRCEKTNQKTNKNILLERKLSM